MLLTPEGRLGIPDVWFPFSISSLVFFPSPCPVALSQCLSCHFYVLSMNIFVLTSWMFEKPIHVTVCVHDSKTEIRILICSICGHLMPRKHIKREITDCSSEMYTVQNWNSKMKLLIAVVDIGVWFCCCCCCLLLLFSIFLVVFLCPLGIESPASKWHQLIWCWRLAKRNTTCSHHQTTRWHAKESTNVFWTNCAKLWWWWFQCRPWISRPYPARWCCPQWHCANVHSHWRLVWWWWFRMIIMICDRNVSNHCVLSPQQATWGKVGIVISVLTLRLRVLLPWSRSQNNQNSVNRN